MGISKHQTMQDIRQELGVVSQGRVSTGNSVLFHLAFRMSIDEAKEFILTAAKQETSESLLACKLIRQYLREVKENAVR